MSQNEKRSFALVGSSVVLLTFHHKHFIAEKENIYIYVILSLALGHRLKIRSLTVPIRTTTVLDVEHSAFSSSGLQLLCHAGLRTL